MTTKQVWLCVAVLLLCFGVVGHMDYEEAIQTERERTAWLQDHCVNLTKNQQAIVTKRNDGSVQCAKYDYSGYGGSKKLVFAEVTR